MRRRHRGVAKRPRATIAPREVWLIRSGNYPLLSAGRVHIRQHASRKSPYSLRFKPEESIYCVSAMTSLASCACVFPGQAERPAGAPVPVPAQNQCICVIFITEIYNRGDVFLTLPRHVVQFAEAGGSICRGRWFNLPRQVVQFAEEIGRAHV